MEGAYIEISSVNWLLCIFYYVLDRFYFVYLSLKTFYLERKNYTLFIIKNSMASPPYKR